MGITLRKVNITYNTVLGEVIGILVRWRDVILGRRVRFAKMIAMDACDQFPIFIARVSSDEENSAGLIIVTIQRLSFIIQIITMCVDHRYGWACRCSREAKKFTRVRRYTYNTYVIDFGRASSLPSDIVRVPTYSLVGLSVCLWRLNTIATRWIYEYLPHLRCTILHRTNSLYPSRYLLLIFCIHTLNTTLWAILHTYTYCRIGRYVSPTHQRKFHPNSHSKIVMTRGENGRNNDTDFSHFCADSFCCWAVRISLPRKDTRFIRVPISFVVVSSLREIC